MNTYVDRIVRRQACLGGFVESSSPFSEASEDKDDDDDVGNEDEDASSFGDDEMTA